MSKEKNQGVDPIYIKIAAIQDELNPIKKDSKNPYHNSKYFDINKLISVLKPLLSKHKLMVRQAVDGDTLVTWIVDLEYPSALSSSLKLPETMDPQKMGSAITYYRRYMLVCEFFMEAEDDDGNGPGRQKRQTQNTSKAAPAKKAPTAKKSTPIEDPKGLSEKPMEDGRFKNIMEKLDDVTLLRRYLNQQMSPDQRGKLLDKIKGIEEGSKEDKS